MRAFSRILGALTLLALAAFCVFGFLASFEPSETSRLPWKVGYAAMTIVCLTGAVQLLRSGRM